jgi:predicted nucleic acid-binding protein
MTLYAETSAVIAWLLAEPKAQRIAECLETAEVVLCSELTIMECERVLLRCLVDERISAEEAHRLKTRLHRVAEHWTRMKLSAPVMERAGRRFPVEPVRSLDAIHLASAIRLSNSVPGMQMLSLDARIRENALALGFEVVPVGLGG